MALDLLSSHSSPRAGTIQGPLVRHFRPYLLTHTHAPDMPDTISGAETRRKGTPHSLAIAFASAVFPHPGGPCSRTPLGGSTPSQAYT